MDKFIKSLCYVYQMTSKLPGLIKNHLLKKSVVLFVLIALLLVNLVTFVVSGHYTSLGNKNLSEIEKREIIFADSVKSYKERLASNEAITVIFEKNLSNLLSNLRGSQNLIMGSVKIEKSKNDLANFSLIALFSKNNNLGVYEQKYASLKILEDKLSYQNNLYSYFKELLDYNPELDILGESVSQNKNDFMYRVSLTMYNMNQIISKLEKLNTNPQYIAYNNALINKIKPVTKLADELLWATKYNQVQKSNDLRSQFIKQTEKLKIDLASLLKQISRETI